MHLLHNYSFDSNQCVGSGSDGCVYKSVDEKRNQIVAIKKITNSASFHHQNSIHTQILFNHVNIVDYIEAFSIADDMNFIVMEYLPMTLLDFIDSYDSPPPFHFVKNFIYQITNAVHFLHSRLIIHLDIKPENILLVPKTMTLKLCDFGLSETIKTRNDKISNFQVQTPPYRAPEIFRESPYSFPADIWSIGCLSYEIATGGILLFTANNKNDFEQELSKFKYLSDTERLSISDEYIGPDAEAFIKWVLNENPRIRPSASDILNHLYIKS